MMFLFYVYLSIDLVKLKQLSEVIIFLDQKG
jgi:hypothetical protein